MNQQLAPERTPYEIWTPKDNYTRKKSIYKGDHRGLFPLRRLSRFGINLNENWTDANTLKRIQPAWNKFDNFFFIYTFFSPSNKTE